jgi:hypothetical protein
MTVSTPSRTVVFAYSIGDIVYHRLATEKQRGMVTGLQVRPSALLYDVVWPNRTETQHYEMELTTEFVPDYESGS